MAEESKEIPITTVDHSSPSRYQLLSMVRKQSKFLKDTAGEYEDVSNGGMDSRFWQEMLCLYFLRGNFAKDRGQEDDLIFFITKMNLHGYGFNDSVEDVPPFFVRRWAPTLEKVIGGTLSEVDWARSFYLNLIAHTSFTVTVAICSIHALRKHQNDENSSLSPVYKVVKTVYASPSRVNFHLDHKKSAETEPAYPNICFAVDDFDDTFDAVVLSEMDHCYCVVLNANDGAAFPLENNEINITCSSSSYPLIRDDQSSNPSKVTLFSGFVSYQMVREAYAAGQSRLESLLSLGQSHTKTDKLYMRGPGGRGQVEVAVSGIADQSQERAGPTSPRQLLRKGIGMIVHGAAELAKHAYAGPTSSTNSNENKNKNKDSEIILPLKCCLMSISLPWELIAHDLLFKASPPLDL